MSPLLEGRLKKAIYESMWAQIDCGPFDGGCLVFAHALQRVLGGEVHVIVGRLLQADGSGHKEAAHHAILALPNGDAADASGLGSIREIVGAFIREECPLGLDVTEVRAMAPGDLPEACRSETLVAELALRMRNLPARLQRLGYSGRSLEGEAPMVDQSQPLLRAG